MAAATRSVSLEGLNGRPIEVEVDVSAGMPGTVIVGMADTTINEARDRVRSAVVNSGAPWPEHRVTVNLAPSTVPKTGSHYDLAIAVAVLVAQGLVPADAVAETVYLGELALDGRLRAIPGVLPAALAAAKAGLCRLVVPEVNVAEAQLVEGLDVIGVRSLRQILALLTGQDEPDEPEVAPLDTTAQSLSSDGSGRASFDFADLLGQEDAKLAAVVAAAGGHHLLMTGPPGIGKTMIAQRFAGLLPDLSPSEAIEVSAVHSVAGLLPPQAPLMRRPPFLDPHHSASAASIVGGGSRLIRPGALSLAHRGVLFLDEAPEFAANVLDSLRQPLESGRVVISRATQMVEYPARFQLLLAANPCPCGSYGSRSEPCRCTTLMRRRYADRISGPIRDRIDIHRELTAPTRAQLAAVATTGSGTKALAALVQTARSRQAERLSATPWRLNSEVPGAEYRRNWPMHVDARLMLDRQLATGRFSARAADRMLRLAWTVADLCGHAEPTAADVDAALSLRRGTGIGADLRSIVEAA